MNKRGWLIPGLCLAWAFCGPAWAELPRALFTVHGVPVDVTAPSLVHARENAIASAQFIAAQRLMRRFVPDSDLGKLGAFTLPEIERLVAGVEVVQEKSAGTRYVGLITVVFRAEEVRRRLRASGVPYTMTLARPVLILPQAEDREWQTLWRVAFEKLPHESWLEGFVLPGAEDESEPSPALAHAHRVDQIVAARIVTEAPPAPQAGVPNAVTVNFQIFGQPTADAAAPASLGSAASDSVHVAREALDTTETLLSRAAAMVMDRVNEGWIRATAEAQSVQSTYPVRASFQSLGDWLALRDVLGSASNVVKVEVMDLSVNSAGLELTIAGTPDKLAFALAQRDIRLQTSGQPWRISRELRK